MEQRAGEGRRLQRSREKKLELRPGEGPIRVFLLGHLFETDFRKNSPGGMLQSKRYFDIAPSQAKNAEELAQRLKGHVWE